MAYERTTWVSGETALSAEHMNNIEDGIEELKNKMGSTRFTIESTGSNVSSAVGYGILDNSTNTVRVYISGNYSADSGANTTIFSIPSGYKPSMNYPIMCVIRTDTGAITTGYGTIKTDGTIVQGLTDHCRGIIGFAEYSI